MIDTRSEWEGAQETGGGARHPAIGMQLQSMTDELVALGEELQGLLDTNLASRIGEALSAVKKQHCRIAVLGQIKAGKSSFVNALIRRPGLLPTDVNPWTAVVTRLHFGMPGQPGQGARFTFFEEDEWRQFAQAAGRLHQLTERLVPGHEEDQYQQNLEAMRRRVELRLGQHYHDLFGTTRWYGEATADVIERYVCLGQHIEEAVPELAPGRYADITKTADLFFEAYPFAAPVTVIDTPGTNDPLLIRDEITLRSIEDADVYVVVLTAQQPLTTADLALLRILHGLRKNRIVVFVNRIDDLSGIVTASHAIDSGVRAVIDREFPSARIPVVIGSAFWANSALDIANADLGYISAPELIDYARHTGVLAAGEAAFRDKSSCSAAIGQAKSLPSSSEAIGQAKSLPSSSAAVGQAKSLPSSSAAVGQANNFAAMPPQRLAGVLFAASGMPAMISHISALMLRGMNGYWLSELGLTLLAAAEGVANSARREITALNGALNKTAEDSPLAADLAHIAAHLQQMRAVAVHIEEYLAAAAEFLRQEIAESLNAMRQTLDNQVTAFATEQSQAVHDAWLHGQGVRTWRCNAVPLRNAMEEHVLHTFWEVGKLLIDTQRHATPEVLRMLQEAVPGIDPHLTPTSLLNFNMTPSLAPLSKAVVFDLEDKWWNLWWRRAHSAEEKAHKIHELVIAEFSPVTAELARSVEADLEKYVSAAIKRFFARGLDVIYAAIEREEKLVITYEALLAASKNSDPATREQEERIAALRHRLTAAEELSAKLKACVDRYAPLIHDEQRAAP